MKKILLLLVIAVIFSCSKDEDLTLTKTIDPDGSADVEVQDFHVESHGIFGISGKPTWMIWAMSVFVNTKEGRAEYTAFLDSEENPVAFFENKLQYIEDRFSFL